LGKILTMVLVKFVLLYASPNRGSILEISFVDIRQEVYFIETIVGK
jgi:hypothetical protein